MLNDFKENISATYLERGLSFAAGRGMEVVSVIFFGGAVKGYISKVSDRDSIFVFSDKTSDNELNSFRRFLESLEVELGLRVKGGVLQIALDRIGAQYKSSFACREKDFVNGDIGAIFYSNILLDSVIQDNPWWSSDIGLKNITSTAKTVYGKDLTPRLSSGLKDIEKRDLLLNRRMHFVLLTYALLTYAISANSTRYALSSVKWALHTCYFGGFGKLGTLGEEVAFFGEALGPKHEKTLRQFCDLRDSRANSFFFILRGFSLVWALYSFTFRNVRFPVSFKRRYE